MREMYNTEKLINCPYCGKRMLLLISTIKGVILYNTLFTAQVVCKECNHRGPEATAFVLKTAMIQAEEAYKK